MQTQSNQLDFSGQKIDVGFDMHLISWKVTIMIEELVHKTFSQSPVKRNNAGDLIRGYIFGESRLVFAINPACLLKFS